MSPPLEPPLAGGDLARTGGGIGPEPEDFRVDEELDRAPAGTGQHRLVRIEKVRLNTRDAVLRVAEAAAVNERDVGYAGMKDNHAVTTQWLSLPAQSASPELWPPLDGIRVLEHALDENKLRTGQLRGNHFRLRLVGCNPGSAERAVVLAERLAADGLLNVFGAQRFGRGGENLERALAWLKSGGARRGRGSRFDKKFLPSVLQSEVFNRYVVARSELGLDRLLEGEVVRLDGTHTTFIVSDPLAEQPRLESGDIHLTGPLPGPKLRAARAAALELELRVLGELELDPSVLRDLGRHAPGTRRDVRVRPERLTVEADGDELRLAFFLPAGSYATEVVRAFTGRPFFEV